MKIVTDHEALSRKFFKTKAELDEAEKSLVRLLGYNRNSCSGLTSEYNKNCSSSSYKILSPSKKTVKRLRDLSESEENESENELPSKKTALRSVVITKVEGSTSRRDVILKQNCNTKIRSRNRRIFGMVQNTLQKFQHEAIKRQSQDLKRIKVEKKVEAAKEEERYLIEKQKMELNSKTKEKLLELQCLRKMMELTESFQVWENNQTHLLSYNMTKAEPKICFLPLSHTSNSLKHLKNSKIKIQVKMQYQKKDLKKKLAEIIKSHQFITPITPSLSPANNCDELEQEYFEEQEKCTVENLYFSGSELLSD